jgi:MFS family permease
MRLWFAVLCGYLALGATIQALPGVIAGGPGEVGLLVTLAAAATAVARPLAGRIADRGHALRVARVGAALVALGAAGHLLPVPLVLARLTIGLGEGALFTGALAYVLAGSSPPGRGRLIGHFGLSMWGGLALGPVAAATVAPREALWLALGTATAALALTALPPRGPARRRARAGDDAGRVVGATEGGGGAQRGGDTHRGGGAQRVGDTHRGGGAQRGGEARPARPGARGRRSAPLIPRAAWRPGIVLGLASFGYGTVNAFAVLQAGGAALAVFGGAFLATRLLGSRLIDDLGPRAVILASTVLEAGALAAATTGSLAAIAVAGAALSLAFPALAVTVVEAAPEHERAAAVGAMTSCWDLGIAAAGPVGALLVSPGHLAPAFAAAAALAGAAAIGAVGKRTREFPDVAPRTAQQDAAP